MQHRAVAAERDDEVEVLGEPVGRPHRTRRDRPSRLRSRGRAPPRRARGTTPRPRRASSCATRDPGAERGRPRLHAAAHAATPWRVGDHSAMCVGIDRSEPPRVRTKNSMLPSAPRNGDATTARTPSPRTPSAVDHLAQHRVVHHRVAHDAALADARPARLELRLHQQHELGVRRGEREQARRDRPERDERQVGDAEVGGRIDAHRLRASRTLVRSITVTRASLRSVHASWPADVDRDHVRGAPLEQAVGEAAGRRADVDRARSGDVDRERVERAPRACRRRARRTTRRAPLRRRRSVRRRRPDGPRSWTGVPLTDTRPATIASTARARLGARPRRTISTSSRRRTVQPARAAGAFAAFFAVFLVTLVVVLPAFFAAFFAGFLAAFFARVSSPASWPPSSPPVSSRPSWPWSPWPASSPLWSSTSSANRCRASARRRGRTERRRRDAAPRAGASPLRARPCAAPRSVCGWSRRCRRPPHRVGHVRADPG